MIPLEFQDVVDYTFKHLKHRSLRTWLTLLGIVAGVFTLVLLVGLSEGLREDVKKQIDAFDPRAIVIYPADVNSMSMASPQFMPTSGKLWDKDFRKIESLPGVKSAARIILGRGSFAYRDKEITVSITGVEPQAYSDVTTIHLEEGRFLTESDSRGVILGWNIAHDLFDEDIRVGSRVYISGKLYRVVGIIEKTGNSFVQFDDMVIIPFQEARDMFSSYILPNEVSAIRLQVAEGENLTEVADNIESVLMNLHKVNEDDKDFSLITPDTINDRVGSIISTLTIFLGAVAAISLLVGSIGISNTMFMAVAERTKEVGVLKSLGARNRDILTIFLVESAFIGLIGGLLGVVFAVLVKFLLGMVGFNVVLGWPLLLGAVGFSIVIGAIAGVFPAQKASKIPPMEALRYE